MRNFRIGNVRLVRGIEDQKRIVLVRIINPVCELVARCDSTSWIVWETKIDEIDTLLWWLGHELVFRRAKQIRNPFVAAIVSYGAGVARHHVRVHVYRIDRIGHRDLVLAAENIEDVTAVVFRSVRNEDFVVSNVNFAVAIVALRDG